MLRGIQMSRFPLPASGMAERSSRSFQVNRSTLASVVRMLPAIVAILLGLAVLVGLDGILVQAIAPLQALAWGILSLGCAGVSLFRADEANQRLFAEAAIAIGIVALSVALIDVFAFAPCGGACLAR
jgi:hypothetical protein